MTLNDLSQHHRTLLKRLSRTDNGEEYCRNIATLLEDCQTTRGLREIRRMVEDAAHEEGIW